MLEGLFPEGIKHSENEIVTYFDTRLDLGAPI